MRIEPAPQNGANPPPLLGLATNMGLGAIVWALAALAYHLVAQPGPTP